MTSLLHFGCRGSLRLRRERAALLHAVERLRSGVRDGSSLPGRYRAGYRSAPRAKARGFRKRSCADALFLLQSCACCSGHALWRPATKWRSPEVRTKLPAKSPKSLPSPRRARSLISAARINHAISEARSQ
jgi:hypothetical protein